MLSQTILALDSPSSAATFSPCSCSGPCLFPDDTGHRPYRYTLERIWQPVLPRIAIIACNPSKATDARGDRTVDKLTRMARRHGYGSLLIMNAFALRSTDPRALRAPGIDPVGPENDHAILMGVATADLVVAAWGVHARLGGREAALLDLLSGIDLFCFALTPTSQCPQHPLYLPDRTIPALWRSMSATGTLAAGLPLTTIGAHTYLRAGRHL
ncbi:MAG: DUF1643 domain-containing protein [Chloroflexota bacterium]